MVFRDILITSPVIYLILPKGAIYFMQMLSISVQQLHKLYNRTGNVVSDFADNVLSLCLKRQH
jgi:hypothetical protein